MPIEALALLDGKLEFNDLDRDKVARQPINIGFDHE
jgi:hypothetical protein